WLILMVLAPSSLRVHAQKPVVEVSDVVAAAEQPGRVEARGGLRRPERRAPPSGAADRSAGIGANHRGLAEIQVLSRRNNLERSRVQVGHSSTRLRGLSVR